MPEAALSTQNPIPRLVSRQTGQGVEILHIEERQGEERILVEYEGGGRGYLHRKDLAVCMGYAVMPDRAVDLAPA
ncbi:MAG: hypothetical protein KDG89_12555 [Geminicoccaceae bacterium]|nr:hypothetical protein [Geminicoccaceae bacterium]